MEDPVDDLLGARFGSRMEFCLKAAELHLARATALAETEWKVTLAFWGVLLASGVSFISYTSTSSPPMTAYIVHSDVIFLVPYLLSAAIFVFGFSVNQAKSIVQERTRFRYYVNQAAREAGDPFLLPDADPGAPIQITRHNRVWAQKLLSTFLFITGIWGAAQWLAYGKLTVLQAEHDHVTVDLIHFSLGPGTAACAFFDCRNRGYFQWGDVPELGTVLWVLALLAVCFFFARAQSGGKL